MHDFELDQECTSDHELGESVGFVTKRLKDQGIDLLADDFYIKVSFYRV